METAELTSSFNLNDIIPQKKITKRLLKADTELAESAKSKLTDINTLHTIFTSCNETLKSDNPLVVKLLKKYNETRFEFFSNKGFLPTEMDKRLDSISVYSSKRIEFNSSSDSLYKLSNTPKASLSDLKTLATKLNMVIIPFEYLNDNSYEKETYEKKYEIKNFNSELRSNFSTFVLCPINHYSLVKHAKSVNPSLPVFTGNHGMVFTSIMFNIPMFRSILNELQDVKDKISSLTSSINNIKDNINLMQHQLDQIQKQVEFQRINLLQQNEEIKSLKTQLSSLAFTVTDPLLFAVKKDLNINDPANDDSTAFVGPVWGPDFNGIALHELGIVLQKGQRSDLEQISRKLWY